MDSNSNDSSGDVLTIFLTLFIIMIGYAMSLIEENNSR